MPRFRDAFQAAQDAWMSVDGELTREKLEVFLREQIDPETGRPFATREEILQLLTPKPPVVLAKEFPELLHVLQGPESRSPAVAKWQGPSREVQRNQPVIVGKAPAPNPPARDWCSGAHASDEPGFSLLPWFSNYWLGVPPPKAFEGWRQDFLECQNKFRVVLGSGPTREGIQELYEEFAAICGAAPFTLNREDAAANTKAQESLRRW
jgi:hypothetical protein